MSEERMYRVYEYKHGIIATPAQLLADHFEITTDGTALFYKDCIAVKALRDFTEISHIGEMSEAQWEAKKAKELEAFMRDCERTLRAIEEM